jgi:hypothetical protein
MVKLSSWLRLSVVVSFSLLGYNMDVYVNSLIECNGRKFFMTMCITIFVDSQGGARI